MSIQNEFGGTLYNSTRSMLEGIAYEFITAGGQNRPDTVDEILQTQTAEDLCDECIEMWNLDQPDHPPMDADDEGSHMEQNEYGRSALLEAFREFIAERPDRKDHETVL